MFTQSSEKKDFEIKSKTRTELFCLDYNYDSEIENIEKYSRSNESHVEFCCKFSVVK